MANHPNTSVEGKFSMGALAVGWLFLYGPTYEKLASTVWRTDEQGHGPIIVALALYLILRRWDRLAQQDYVAAPWGGGILLIAGLGLFIFGHSLAIVTLDVGSQILVLAGLFVVFKGWRGFRLVAFPIAFLVFMIPLPAALVSAVTAPLKLAVSTTAATWLYAFGYPVGRSGVNITIGQYELLVADACAGLNSMFTLEALGFLYMNIMGYKSRLRNALLAISVIPISFIANVMRVMTLILVTYYFGDEVGQGFVHGFAGMLLFIVALVMILLTDFFIGKIALEPRNVSRVLS